MKVVAIVQSRMGSTRLPGKAILPLGGKPLTQNLLERVKRATKLNAVVLAVPATPENECLWQVAHDAGCDFYWYKGDENDLVGRYLDCAKSFDADIIVRVPGDNPCVEPRYVDEAVARYFDIPALFYSNTTVRLTEHPLHPFVDGLGAEVFSVSRLGWVDRRTSGQTDYREHPHRLMYDIAESSHRRGQDCGIYFNVARPDFRLDVNTQADYEFIRDIYDHFGHNCFTIEEVLAYLDQKEAVHG